MILRYILTVSEVVGTKIKLRAQPLRVLHITTEFPPLIRGGVGTAVGGIAIGSARAGIAVGVLLVGGLLSTDAGYSASNPVPRVMLAFPTHIAVVSDGVTFFHVSVSDATEAGVKVACAWHPDVIHLHSSSLWPVAFLIRQAFGTPIVVTVHSLDRLEYEWGRSSTNWEPQEAMFNGADRVIAVSESQRDLLVHYCPAVAQRVRIVGHGIDDSPGARQSARRRRSGAPLVMFSGRFNAHKGMHELLEAIPEVLAAEPETQFVLVGGSGNATDVESAWLEGKLLAYRDKITFTGWLLPAQVMRWYGVADVLVIPELVRIVRNGRPRRYATRRRGCSRCRGWARRDT